MELLQTSLIKESLTLKCGVPKHSELEPDFCLAEGDGNTSTSGSLEGAPQDFSTIFRRIMYPKMDWNSSVSASADFQSSLLSDNYRKGCFPYLSPAM